MSKEVWAITTCRVSTPEQIKNGSLRRQAEAVTKAAKELGVIIPADGQWSGSVSSKAGTNTKRKDLKEMLDYCKKHHQVKYLLVHEVDRFMRSVDELFYFEVLFKTEVGVKIYYASQPELNTDDYKSKLFKALEVFKAEGSNVERTTKSISGQATALQGGRYPSSPKPGYMKGRRRAVPELHPVRGPALKDVLIKLASRQITPTNALIELNNSAFTDDHSPYRMDKFRKIATDPFYAGIINIQKQVKVYNENGLHEPLITKAQHYKLLEIMDEKKKNQSGPRKNGNPKYPCNNIVTCDSCLSERNGRVVGFDHGNGKSNSKVYEKYRCRACGKYLTRQELHDMIVKQFKDNPISSEGLGRLIDALEVVWKQKRGEAEQEKIRINSHIHDLNDKIAQHIEAITDPGNTLIKDDLLAAVQKKKDEIAELESRLDRVQSEADNNKEQFLRFAYAFVENMGEKFLEISQENRLRCKQIVFPAGFHLSAARKVYTPQISPLITLAATKKDAEASNNSHLVRVTGL